MAIPEYILNAARDYRDKHGGNQSLEDAFIAGFKATRSPKKKFVTLTSEQEESFKECFDAYRCKGNEAKAQIEWQKLSDEERAVILPHIQAYVETRDRIYQKDFERYLKEKTFKTVVFRGNEAVYNPNEERNTLFANNQPQEQTINWQ